MADMIGKGTGKRAAWMNRAALVGLVGLVFFGSTYPGGGEASPLAQTAPTLGTAASFAVLGGSTVTNTGPTTVSGDLGVSPGTAVTGFPPGTVTNGTIHAADAVAAQAQSAVTTAYNSLAGQPCPPGNNFTGTDLGGRTLVPGVYCFSTSAQLTGTLTLDAQGDAGAVFIFQIGSTLTTASGSSVLLINGASPCNVFWQVGSSATLGTATSFVGNILALTSIALNTGANITSGRALARNGAVTMDTNTISTGACAASPAATATAITAATATSAAVATATSAAVATATSAAAATATTIAQLPPATQTAIALQTATAVPTAFATSTTNDDEDDRRETEEQRRHRERTNRGNQDDERTEGNVVLVACAPLTVATAEVTMTPVATATAATATVVTAATATPARPLVTATAAAPVQAPGQVPVFVPGQGPVQVPGGEGPEPPDALKAYALAWAQEADAADIPYVVIGNVDGDQRVRLRGDAKSMCSSIRIGDYLEAEGEKQHEQLFDADEVTIRRGGSRIR
jgi:type VI secretion system secreted protein VgrG